MKVVHVALEMAPLAKVGGLGDMVYGLTEALTKSNVNVDVFLPKYKNLNTEPINNLKIETHDFKSFEYHHQNNNKVWSGNLNEVNIHLIDPEKDYFNRDKIYAYVDDVPRFLYFSRAVLDFLLLKNEPIDILHIHDWHTAIIAPLYKDVFSKMGLNIKKIVFTIHNLSYQGWCMASDVEAIGLDGKSYLTPDKMQDPKMKRRLNLLKGAINYSDAVVAVSPTYAKEILTPERGENLDKVLQKNKKKLHGIINGIDEITWDPKKDPYIAKNFSTNDPIEKIMLAKKENKELLCKKIGLFNANVPLVANIGRLVEQKGIELIIFALKQTIKKNGQFILLGTTFDKEISKTFHKLKEEYQHNKHLFIDIQHNEELAHLIYAAADFVVVPSIFEPCGLVQLIGYKYGVIPIVRKTGGLSDTVFDIKDKNIEKRSGFVFNDYTSKDLDEAMQRAFDAWFYQPDEIKKLIKNNLKSDFTGEKAGKEYIHLYKRLME
ncbi:MAG: glycogen synthase [Chlamydiae bacterium]|nr:glycogen synthase [Chlamydiota bacterium]